MSVQSLWRWTSSHAELVNLFDVQNHLFKWDSAGWFLHTRSCGYAKIFPCTLLKKEMQRNPSNPSQWDSVLLLFSINPMKRTKTNHGLICFSVLSNFPKQSVVTRPKPVHSFFGQIFKKGGAMCSFLGLVRACYCPTTVTSFWNSKYDTFCMFIM